MNKELYDLPTNGKSTGHGTVGHGTVTCVEEQFHVQIDSRYGYKYRTYVETIYVGAEYLPHSEQLHLNHGEQTDISGLEFRLGESELHLRQP